MQGGRTTKSMCLGLDEGSGGEREYIRCSDGLKYALVSGNVYEGERRIRPGTKGGRERAKARESERAIVPGTTRRRDNGENERKLIAVVLAVFHRRFFL